MIIRFKKFIIILLGVLIVINPIFEAFPIKTAKAEETSPSADVAQDNDSYTDNPQDIQYEGDTSINTSSSNSIIYDIQNKASEDQNDIFSFTNTVTGFAANPRIVLNQNDMLAIKSLYCLASVMPDWDNDFEKLYAYLPDTLSDSTPKPAAKDDLIKIKFEDPAKFQKFVSAAKANWGQTSDIKQTLMKEIQVIEDSRIGNSEYSVDISSAIKDLTCITGLTSNELSEFDRTYLEKLVNASLESLVLDIRVLKTLVYLVTPKDQGGAGHWKIRVKKITQLQNKPYSDESESVRLSLGGQTNTTTSNCTEEMSAAECGQSQRASETSAQEEENMLVEDRDGTQYNAYLETLDNNETGTGSAPLNPPDKNISAHTEGKAIDISEIDDIRCTLKIVKTKGNLFGTTGQDTTLEKKPMRPIKLAWQTQESYAASGGNASNLDLMGMMKSMAMEEVRNLANSLGGDVTDYEGDLTNTNFNDIIGIIGKSLFGELINSPSHDLSGYNTEDTLKKLGAMYFADYLGLPRDVFLNRDISTIDDIEFLIGEAAVERKLGVPSGSLSGFNAKKSAELEKPVYDLEGTLVNFGQRKMEYELGLNPGDLDELIINDDGNPNQNIIQTIGKRVIEKNLNIPKNKFIGKDFNELKNNIGRLKAEAYFAEPSYIDNVLHIDPGKTKELMAGQISPIDFTIMVGQIRTDDTINGLRYFSANDSAYNLPSGTWEAALKFQREALKNIGIITLSKQLGTPQNFSQYVYAEGNSLTDEEKAWFKRGELQMKSNPDDLGTSAVAEWLKLNLTLTDRDACRIPDVVKQSVPATVTKSRPATLVSDAVEWTEPRDFMVNISEDNAIKAGFVRGDLHRMFGCATASTRVVLERVGSKMLYYGIANKYLNREDRISIDLADTEPELTTNIPEIKFYLDRIQRAKKLIDKIKTDWEGEDIDISEVMFHINNIKEDINKVDLSQLYLNSNFNQSPVNKIARDIASEIDALKLDYEILDKENRVKIKKINNTITEVNELILIVSEVIAGKEIASADRTRINQIALTSSDNNTNGSANSRGKTTKGGIDARIIFDFLGRRLSATDLFIRIGAHEAEQGLSLPANSLVYLVQNYEKAGIKNKEAFYMAIGQAKIEETYSMPSFYFQGDELNKNVPDFTAEANFDLLTQYAGNEIGNAQLFFMMMSMQSNPNNYSKDGSKGFVRYLKTTYPDIYKQLIDAAKANWQTELQQRLGQRNGFVISEKNLSDVGQNVVNRGYSDNIRSGGDDILFRMGIVGRLDGLKNYFTSAAEKQAEAADYKLGLQLGSTKALIMQRKVPLRNGADLLSDDEKQQVEATLGIGKNTLDVYLKLLNNDFSIDEINRQGLGPDYVHANPYAKQPNDQAGSCPIGYQLKATEGGVQGNFRINETSFDSMRNRDQESSLTNDSYCIVDKGGRKCFESKNEAQRYAVEHPDDQFGTILESMAASLFASLPPYFSSPEEFKTQLDKFVRGQTDSIFTDQQYDNIEYYNQQLAASNYPQIPISVLKKLFIRDKDASPLTTYKSAVGRAEAKRVVGWQLWSTLGIKIDPSLFGPDDLYNILNGDYSSLYQVGSYYFDKVMNFDPGMTMMIVLGFKKENRDCALSEAGARILGNLVGMESVPIRGRNIGDITKNIGEAKVEQTLGLPAGTFYGETLSEVISRIKPMNFALIFKIPLSTYKDPSGQFLTPIDQDDMEAAIGRNAAEGLKNATGPYKLRQILDYLSTSPGISDEQRRGINNIDQSLQTYIEWFLGAYATGQLGDKYKDQIPQGEENYYYEFHEFKNLESGLDATFGIDRFDTVKMFKGEISPNHYIEKIGNGMAAKAALTNLAERLGLDGEAATAAADLAIQFSHVFITGGCPVTKYYWSEGGVDYVSDTPPASYLHYTVKTGDSCFGDLGMLYDKLDKIFKFNLDSKAEMPPGTIESLLADPAHAHVILMQLAAAKLDQKFGLPKEGILNSKYFTFKGLYEQFSSSFDHRERDRQCQAQVASTNDLRQLDIELHDKQDVLKKFAKIKDPSDEDKAAADQAKARIIEIINAKKAINDQVANCKRGNRADVPPDGEIPESPPCNWLRPASCADERDALWRNFRTQFVSWLKDGISDVIYTQINDLTISGVHVGVAMPLSDVNKMVWGGNLTYLGIASMAMAVNYVQNSSGQNVVVPASMRISYADILQAFIPNAAMINAARNAATAAYNRVDPNTGQPAPEAFDAERIQFGLGERCPVGADFFGGILQCKSDEDVNFNNIGRSESEVINATSAQIQQGFGCDTADPNSPCYKTNGAVTLNNLRLEGDLYNQVVTGGKTGCDPNQPIRLSLTACAPTFEDRKPTCDRNSNDSACNAQWDTWNNDFMTALNRSVELDNNYAALRNQQDQAERYLRKTARENLEFRAADQALYRLDQNVYPGFSRAMMKGSGRDRGQALATYFRNGLLNGQLFGAKFDAIPEYHLEIAQFLYELATRNPDALNNFADGAGFNILSNWVAKNSFQWIGINLDADMVKGLIAGAFTNQWGKFNPEGANGNDPSSFIRLRNGATIPTLGHTLAKAGMNWLYQWGDKQLGLPLGSTKQIYEAGKNVYESTKRVNELMKVTAATNPATLSQSTQKFIRQKYGIKPGDPIPADKLSNQTKAMAKQAMADAYTQLISFIVVQIVHSMLGEAINSLEEQWGLTPGSLGQLVDAAVGYGVAYVATTYFGASANLLASATTGLWIGLAIFIIVNLFEHVTKIDVSYICSADGYYPFIDRPSSSNVLATTGLGEWDGQAVMMEKSVSASQIKARQLIVDVLTMQENPLYKDTIPSQVMTGRNEDVSFTDPLINTNLCSLMGMKSIGGICGGNSRAGVWANPQTIAWTHIGF